MGLDMSVNRKTYVKNWDHMAPEEKHTITIEGPKAKNIKPKRIEYIIEDMMYWRKANAIHKWFVDHVQDGEDKCQESYIPTEKLKELYKICKTVLANSELVDGQVQNGAKLTPMGMEAIMQDGKKIKDATVAGMLLPTEEGFFFGSTDYDQYYYQDIEDTAKWLEELFKEPDWDRESYYYQASW